MRHLVRPEVMPSANGDEVYGGDPALRTWPAAQGIASVLAVA